MQYYTLEQVAAHNTAESAWVVIEGRVLDVTKFARLHPAGSQVLLAYAGKDATEVFFELHSTSILHKYLKRLQVGEIKGFKGKRVEMDLDALSRVAYAEPAHLQGWKSRIWKPEHAAFRLAIRRWLNATVRPHTDSDRPPSSALFQKAGDQHFWALKLGPGPHLHGKTVFGVPGEDITYFHEMIAHEELCRLAAPGWADGFGTGLVIGAPPVMNFAQPALKERVMAEVLSGRKRICLAVSEPYAGSDVANIRATATKSACGKFYIVNGIKKWITNGMFSDYFTVAVRTGGPGMKGISLLLVERGPGLTTRSIKTSYSAAAGTALVVMEDLKVPVENLLGQENRGFRVIMKNFNHERWFIVAITCASSRTIIEQCFRWCMLRKAFGKPLMSQPVIREKLAKMIAQNESLYAWLESITDQMHRMSYEEQGARLAGPLSIIKMHCAHVSHYVADEACQIFGGRAITKQGMGKYVERFQRSIKFSAILGGSSEVMGDSGIKMAAKFFPTRNSKL